MDDLGRRLLDLLGEPASRELLAVLELDEPERAALIGQLHASARGQALAEVLAEGRPRPPFCIVRNMRDIGGFDPTFDFRTDAGGGDPDSTSPALRAYHKLLWSKPLPSGGSFDLHDTTPGAYLHHRSLHGEFHLTSDAAIPTFIRYRRMTDIIRPIPESERDEFDTITYQMGGMMLFPGNKIDGKQTINGAKGFHPRIADRLDLTVECIRQHFLGGSSPLADALGRYRDFFALFEDFGGYVGFFLLQDLVSDDSSSVRFLMPFADFTISPLPHTIEEYQDYRRNAIRFVQARNRRMAEYVARMGGR